MVWNNRPTAAAPRPITTIFRPFLRQSPTRVSAEYMPTRVADDAAGFGQLLELLAEHGEDEPTQIEIAIETDQGLFVAALVTAGFTLFSD